MSFGHRSLFSAEMEGRSRFGLKRARLALVGDMKEGLIGVDSRRPRFNGLLVVFDARIDTEVIGDVLRLLDGDSFMIPFNLHELISMLRFLACCRRLTRSLFLSVLPHVDIILTWVMVYEFAREFNRWNISDENDVTLLRT